MRDAEKELLELAQSVFKIEDASMWMNKPHELLDGATPLDVARSSSTGAERVWELLVAIKYGGAA